MGSWTAYLISLLYVEYRTRKEREKVDFRNHVIQVPSFYLFLFFSHTECSFRKQKKKKLHIFLGSFCKFFSWQWFEVLDGLLGKHWRNIGLFFNCTFLLFGSVIQLIACAR